MISYLEWNVCSTAARVLFWQVFLFFVLICLIDRAQYVEELPHHVCLSCWEPDDVKGRSTLFSRWIGRNLSFLYM